MMIRISVKAGWTDEELKSLKRLLPVKIAHFDVIDASTFLAGREVVRVARRLLLVYTTNTHT
jgi:hypothetical protein